MSGKKVEYKLEGDETLLTEYHDTVLVTEPCPIHIPSIEELLFGEGFEFIDIGELLC